MQRIKEIGIISLAKIMCCIYAFFGLVVGIFIALTKMVGFELAGAYGINKS